MSYLYHFKPQKMQGDILYPLNALKSSNPKAYDFQAQKYKGREVLLKKEIQLLNCLWNDVIHLAPINPQKIVDCWKREGLLPKNKPEFNLEYFKIPISMIEEHLTVCFQSFNFEPGNFDPSLNKFWKFDKDNFVEQEEVSLEQIKVWHQDHENKRKKFWYSHTCHILTKNSINTKGLEVLTIEFN